MSEQDPTSNPQSLAETAEESTDPSFYKDNDYILTEEELREIFSQVKEEAKSVNEVEQAIAQLKERGPFINDVRLAVRCFHFEAESHIGLLLEQTDDSYFVLFLSTLSRDATGAISAISVMPSIVTRMPKSICMLGMPAPSQLLYYLGLMENRFKEAPSFFTQERISHTKSLVRLLEQQLKVVRVETTVETPTKTVTKQEKKRNDDAAKIVIGDASASKLVH